MGGFPYFNTSLRTGDVYPDEFSKVLNHTRACILLTFEKGAPAKVKTKSLDGVVLDLYFSKGKE